MSFNKLKQSSDDFEKLNSQLQKMSSGEQGSYDERFWKPEVDKAGNGYAVIRFLPAPDGEDVPFVRYYDHAFQGPGGAWYIENSLTTLGQQDPVSEYNSNLWNTGIESNKQIARNQKRNLRYISNIYVVNDPAHPENNGKVFLFRYGKKIFEKLNDAMNPKFPDDPKINPFNMWSGANFKLKITKDDGYRSYAKSEFDSPKPLKDDDAELEAIYNQEFGLQEFIAPSKFKSYDELKAKFLRVIGGEAPADKPLGDNGFATPKPQKTAEAKAAPTADFSADDASSDDFFKELMKGE
jgi:hypothetical protein